MKKWLMAVLTGTSLMIPALAVDFVKTVSSGEVKQGEWNSNFTAVKEKADEYGVPMVVFWANPGCGWCGVLEKTCTRPEVISYLESQQLLLAFGRGMSGENAKVYSFAQRDAREGYPFIRVYWPKGGVDKKFMGRYTEMVEWDSYNGSDWWDTTSHRFRTTLSKLLSGWQPFSINGGEVTPVKPTPQPTPQPVKSQNNYVKTAAKLTLPVMRAEAGHDARGVAGVLDFSSTSVGKVAVKYGSMKSTRSLSIPAGIWKVGNDGVATASGSKNGVSVTFTLDTKGLVSAKVSDPAISGELATEPVSIAGTGFAGFRGSYTAVLMPWETESRVKGPAGASMFSVKMTGISAAAKGQAKVAVILPNGKSVSVSAFMARTAEKKVILPVLKRSGGHTVRALLAFSAEPTARTPNVIVDLDGAMSAYSNEEASTAYDLFGTIYGSCLVGAVRGQSLEGWEFGADPSATAIGMHGEPTGVRWPLRSSINAQGLIKGSARVELSDGRSNPAKFTLCCLPGWEDVLGAKAVGAIWYRDLLDGRNASLGFPAYLQRVSTDSAK